MPKVTIYTQVYNAGPYLRPCIDSVLAQTHTDWEHIIADAGSTDGSIEILKEYAARDKRVKFIQLPENRWSQYEMTEKYATGDYYASLDHDDWWEPEYLERLLNFLQRNNLDLAITGVMQYFEGSGTTVCLRRVPKPVVLPLEKFAQRYDEYGSFVNARWATLMPTQLYLSMKKEYDEMLDMKIVWRSDTILMLKYLPHFRRIGIDNSAMQYYRKHAASQIHQYEKDRFSGQLAFFEAVEEFLKGNHGFDARNQAWLKAREIAEIMDTFRHILESGITAAEKWEETVRILSHPIISDMLSCQCSLLDQWYETLSALLLDIMEDGSVDVKEMQPVISLLAPSCCKMIPYVGKELFQQIPDLLPLLLKDDSRAVIDRLIELAEKGSASQAKDLGRAIQALLKEDVPLKVVSDTKFYQEYPDICRFIIGGASVTALDYMTGLLLEDKMLYGEEGFLSVYLTLSAQMGQVSAFLFGKIRLARFYFKNGKVDDCVKILNELEEMGAGEQEEVVALRMQVQANEQKELQK